MSVVTQARSSAFSTHPSFTPRPSRSGERPLITASRQLGLIAAFFLAVAVSGCGGNNTTIGVTVSAIGQQNLGSSPTAPVSVLKGQTQTFSASVTGGSTTTVSWQICLPVAVTSPLTQPKTCTPIPGVTGSGSSTVTGYGTITQNGVYTAPTTIPQSNSFEVMAVSTVNSTAFGVSYVRIDSGIRVQMIPISATIATQETYSITANVTGTTNTAVTWSVNSIVGGNATDGTVVPTGPQTALYTAPAAPLTAMVTATSAADSSQSADSTITVVQAADPKIASLDPSTAEQGSAQQDVYLTGTEFFSTSQIIVNGAAVPTTWISETVMRATIPPTFLSQAASLPVQVRQQNGDVSSCASSGGCVLSVNPVRPALIASSPNSVVATATGFGVNLTGGFFSQAATTVTFDGFPGTTTGVGTAMTFASSRQMTANIPAGSLSVPGLYPIVIQNSGLAAGTPSTSAGNIAVTPGAGTLLTSPTATVSVGSSPSAIAVDEADGLAVVANTGGNSVSIINLAANSVQTVAVGNSPTGIAVDDALPAPLHPIAVVVNSADNTVSSIDLTTNAVSAPVPLPPLPSNSGSPYSIGINPVTHHAIVANASTNIATILDLSSGTPVVLLQVGGTPTQTAPKYGTGPQPAIAIDPRLNWAVVTSGGGGTPIVNFVDLGRDAIAGVDPGRQPSVVGDLTLATGVQGVGLNAETHQVLLTTPTQGNFTTLSLLDQSVETIPFTNQGVIVNQPGYIAAAISALPNIGVALNSNGNTAAILDLQNRLVVQNVTVGNSPVAVAIDPATNEALVVNQADGTVSIVSLGTVRSSASLGSSQAPQITLSSPGITYTSAIPLTLTVNGGGFASGAQVFLDGTAMPSIVSANGRRIVATVPANMLSAARRYSVYVQNPGQAVISNVEDLTVVQAISVGAQPFGVAIDTDCDVAAVTNSGDGTVSLVALTANAAPPGKTCVSAGAVGTVGSPISVGTAPQGIAIDPLLGLAVVANNGSNNASIVDLTETNPPSSVSLCSGPCTGVAGVGINPDTAVAYVADVATTSLGPSGNLSSITLPTTGLPSNAAPGGGFTVDPDPEAIAVNPTLDYLGVAIAGQIGASTVDILNLQQNTSPPRPAGFNLPTGIIFDPLNQVFVVANSLINNVGFVDPISGVASFAQVGMNPTALDYNYQTSTLVTANNASQTLSILDYVCPPTLVANCSAPQVRDILGLGGSPQFSVAIDAKLNLAVLTDQNNNRVLLIPLP
jgi:DNA-binding beta-propeller fold protein YncE